MAVGARKARVVKGDKVKKFVDMSKREVYDKHNNPKENDFDRN